jgi:hypothetical protein
VSVESRSPILSLRRAKKGDERPDYSEPDFSGWAAKLDNYISPAQAEAAAQAARAAQEAQAAQAALDEHAKLAAAAVAGAVAAVAAEEQQWTVLAGAPATATASDVAAAVPASDDHLSLGDVLEKLLGFDGALSVALVDSVSGMTLGKAGGGVDIELAAAGASGLLRARLASSKTLGIEEKIDDLLITLSTQIQIIHPLPSNPTMFTYLIADKSKASLAMARYKATEADLQIQL